ncbi:MAG: alpha/beta hydrolase-fold protein [Gammaproteobacteria bacterium]|nr:alpha/beta hydrolase-fold protein [Gammaproteobacteria bacterium]MDH3552636.1 alpha/beta hydrolase-fold protein [Gammaproteobacteria bacterium]
MLPPALVTDLMPFIDKTYRTKPGAEKRAIAGLSRGGMLVLVAFNQIDKLGWVRSVSGGFPLMPRGSVDIPPPENADELRGPDITETIDPNEFLALLPQLDASANSRLDLLYVRVGAQDGLITANRAVNAVLKSQGVDAEYIEMPGYGHEWPYWRVARQDFVTTLFQPPSN